MAGCCRAGWHASWAPDLPLDWVFACGRAFLATEGDPFAHGLGGTEQAIIHLTSALAARGARVRVRGGCAAPRLFQGVQWQPDATPASADVTVAINDARLLRLAGGLPVVWFHNEVEALRELRKSRLPALWRHRPAAVFIGSEQARLASRLLGFRARAVIPYGLPPLVLSAETSDVAPPRRALFTSQAYRGLAQVMAMWRRSVAPHVAGAQLQALIGAGDVAPYASLADGVPSISVGARVGNDAVLDLLRGARLVLAPGHRSETFCLAAAEAIAMGVPVITLGIGSLKERVADGETGFVCRDWDAMAARTRAVLTDDGLWRHLHATGLATRANAGWDQVAARWEAFAHEHIGH